MFLGLTVIQGGISTPINQFADSDWNSQIVLTRIEHPEQYGVAELGEDGASCARSKSPGAAQRPALVGIYMFDRHLRGGEAIKPSAGRAEITDAIQWLVDHDCAVHPYVHTGWWIDTGAPGDMLSANDLVLEEIGHVIEGP